MNELNSNDVLSIIEKNSVYSVEIDPNNQYSFSNEEKAFITAWIEYKNILMVSQATGITTDICTMYINKWAIKEEIRRITNAIYMKRFATKLISIEQIESYLDSLLTDENVPFADRINGKDKLEVVKLILKVKEMKEGMIEKPDQIIDVSLEKEVDKLSVDEIKKILYSRPETIRVKKREVEKANAQTPEEQALLLFMNKKERKKELKKEGIK